MDNRLRLAKLIKAAGSCRKVFAAESENGTLRWGDALRLIGMAGQTQHCNLIGNYFRDHGLGAQLAPLLVTLKSNVLRCYLQQPSERASLELNFENVTVVEPSTGATMSPEVAARIAKLEEFKKLTSPDLHPNLKGISRDKWNARLLALDDNERDVPIADIGAPVTDGLRINQHLRERKSESWQDIARKSIDAELTKLRELSSPPTPEVLRKAMLTAFGDVFETVVELVEKTEEAAICAMPAAEPALTEALTKRYAPRAEAAAQKYVNNGIQGGNETHRVAKEQGVAHPGLKAARKKNAQCTFGACLKPSGDERAPNNNYKPYVYKRIKHGIAKATKITSWMKYEEPKFT